MSGKPEGIEVRGIPLFAKNAKAGAPGQFCLLPLTLIFALLFVIPSVARNLLFPYTSTTLVSGSRWPMSEKPKGIEVRGIPPFAKNAKDGAPGMGSGLQKTVAVTQSDGALRNPAGRMLVMTSRHCAVGRSWNRFARTQKVEHPARRT